MGVMIFGAVFGVSAGMAVGTLVGYLRVGRLPKAPDAEREGRKPLVMGFAIPLATFVIAVTIYFQVLMATALKLLSQR